MLDLQASTNDGPSASADGTDPHVHALPCGAPGLLTEGRERSLLAAFAANGDRAALGELLTAHTRLVVRIARRYRAGTVREEDLLAEGMMGLFEAARRFDPRFGVRFSTYAAHWARAFIQRHALAHRRIVPMPDTRAARRVIGRIGRVEPKLSALLGRAPTEAELASALGVDETELSTVRTSMQARDVVLGGATERTGWEPCAAAVDPEAAVAEAEEHAARSSALGRALASLPERERRIVERRCLTQEPPTLDVLAAEMSLSRERVRQLEARAIGRLRAVMLEAA